ncbi:4215_t:CDS:2 [Entrophospora sp. SA101]|nr:4215_t:CDS:2 [Entrophospora sp. SA101]
MAKFWRSHRITICLLLCLLLLGGDSLDISSNTGDKDQPILSVDAFFDKLDTINDLNQLVATVEICAGTIKPSIGPAAVSRSGTPRAYNKTVPTTVWFK